MKPHHAPTDELRDQAMASALDQLPETEAAAYARHLETCGVCRSLEREARETAFDLSLSAAAEVPPPALRERLLERIAPAVQSWKSWTGDAAGIGGAPFSYAFASDGVWEATGTPGVEARRLFVDEANDRVAMLIRMEAGASYPGHRHNNPEDCFVVQGDLYAHDFSMKAGDYRRAHAGSTDPVQSTRGGCILFIISSLHDELAPNPAV